MAGVDKNTPSRWMKGTSPFPGGRRGSSKWRLRKGIWPRSPRRLELAERRWLPKGWLTARLTANGQARGQEATGSFPYEDDVVDLAAVVYTDAATAGSPAAQVAS
jgi:hypothetical protein